MTVKFRPKKSGQSSTAETAWPSADRQNSPPAGRKRPAASRGRIPAAGRRPEAPATAEFPVLTITPTQANLVVGLARDRSGRELEIRVNVYQPEPAAAPTPVVVYIHGGRWLEGDYRCENLRLGWSENSSFRAAMSLVSHGFAVVTAGYRTSDQAPFPAQIHDVKGVVRYLRAQAGRLHLDPRRIYVWGESAGAHLAALLGVTEGRPELEGRVGGRVKISSAVQGVVEYFGMTDLLELAPDNYRRPWLISPAAMWEQADSPSSSRAALIGFAGEGEGLGTLRGHLGPARAPYHNPGSPYQAFLRLLELATPLNFVSSTTCPFFIAQGGRDERVAPAQSFRLFEALTKAGVEAYMMASAQAGHGRLGAAVDRAAVDFLIDLAGRR